MGTGTQLLCAACQNPLSAGRMGYVSKAGAFLHNECDPDFPKRVEEINQRAREWYRAWLVEHYPDEVVDYDERMASRQLAVK